MVPGFASALPIFTQDFDPDLFAANGSSDLGSDNQRADNFSIGVNAVLGTISWLGIYHGSSTPASDNFSIRFFQDNGSGLPETMAFLNENVGNNVNRMTTTNAAVFSYQANLSTGINLLSGTTYWLSIVNNVGTSPSDDWGWAASSTAGTAASRSLDSDAWGSGNGTFQFELTAVPLPAAFWLLASGLFGLASIRKKAKT